MFTLPENFQISENLLNSVKLNMAAQTLESLLRPTIINIQGELLKEFHFRSRWADDERVKLTENEKIVLDPAFLHHLTDEDSSKYFKRLHKEYIKNGFRVKEPGNCPLLRAEWLVTESENLIIDTAVYATGIHREQLTSLKLRQRCIDIIIRLVLNLNVISSDIILAEFCQDPETISNSIKKIQQQLKNGT